MRAITGQAASCTTTPNTGRARLARDLVNDAKRDARRALSSVPKS
jgi:hypothetical protein